MRQTSQGEPPQHEMALGLKYLTAIERAGGIPVVCRRCSPRRPRRCSTTPTIDLEALRARAESALIRDGVSFTEDAFVIDPIPRILTGGEWGALDAAAIIVNSSHNGGGKDTWVLG